MFSLRMLMAVVAVSAVYIAGMVHRTPWWEAAIVTLTLAIYGGAITGATLSRQHRPFFVAFAIFGLSYGLCLFLVEGKKLAPERVLDEAVQQVEILRAETMQVGPWGHSRFKTIGLSLFGVVISFCAGLVADAVVIRSMKAVRHSESAQ